MNELPDGYLRRIPNQRVDMVLLSIELQQAAVIFRSYIRKKHTHGIQHFGRKHPLSIFGDKDEVNMQGGYGVSSPNEPLFFCRTHRLRFL